MQSAKPLLSVLVPAFNVGSFIDSCIRSLLLQTYTSIEILVCDDGSTDDTWEQINKFSDPRLKVFRNLCNVGKNQTSNFLLGESKGDYITIHDGDDLSSASRFEEQMAFLIGSPDYVMCGTNFISFLNNGKILAKSRLATSDEVIRERIKEVSQFHGPTVVFKRSIIPMVGGLYRYFTRAEDIDFTMRVTEKFKVCNLPGHYYFYRHQSFSLTNNIRGYNVERLAHTRLLYYLAEERSKNDGIDSLMRGEMDKVNQIVSEFSREYENDPEIALRRGVFRLLKMHMYNNAMKLAWIAVVRKQNTINIKCLVYAFLQYLKGRYFLIRMREKIDLRLLQ